MSRLLLISRRYSDEKKELTAENCGYRITGQSQIRSTQCNRASTKEEIKKKLSARAEEYESVYTESALLVVKHHYEEYL